MSYISDLQTKMTPEQYAALTKPISKHYKGKIQDWQAQILTPLDTSKVGLPTQLTVTTKAPQTYYVDVGEGTSEARTKTFQPELDKSLSKDFTPQYDTVTGSEGEVTSSTLTGFRSKNPVTVNGLPVYAVYDATGKLTGYEGKGDKRAYVNDSTSLKGVWDANGVAKPKPITASGGGFVKGLINDVASIPALNAAITVGAGIYGGPEGVAAWNAAKTKAAGGDLGDVLESGAKGYALAYGAQQLGQNFGPSADVGGADIGTADMGSGGGGLESEGLMSGGSTGTGLKATGDLGLTGGNTANLDLMGGAQGLTSAGTTGAILGETGGALAAGGLGAGIGLTDAAAGTGSLLSGAAAGAAGAGAAGTLTDAALLKGGLSLAGGLLQGETTKDALTADATARTKLANEVKDMGKFTPVGITTTFGTSNFVTDPVTGTITPSYTLSPTAKAWQDSLGGLGTTALSSASNIMNLGNQYIGESPEAVRQRYIDVQKSLLAPGQEQDLAKIRNNLANTGRSGLAYGATSDGMMATNPELAAYYNSIAMTNRNIAADSDKFYKDQVNFGTGLLSNATKPFTSVFDASKSVEEAAQQPLKLSTDFANTAATRGAATGANYANAMSPSLESSYKASATDPLATFLQGLSDSDLAIWGLSKVKP